MTERVVCDVVIIGGGIVGAACARAIAPHMNTIIVERETLPGYHSTGRSAALYTEYFGDRITKALTRASREDLMTPQTDLGNNRFLDHRGTLVLISEVEKQDGTLDAILSKSTPDLPVRLLNLAEAREFCPILKTDAHAAAVYRERTWDIDVDTLLRSFLTSARNNGCQLLNNCQITEISEKFDGWTITCNQNTTELRVKSSFVVNAAGAWGDAIAELAGQQPIGLIPKRRSVAYVEDERIASISGRKDWPMVNDVNDTFYFKSENNGLIVSPCDETPSHPTDAQPDELDIAVAIDLLEKHSILNVTRVANRWAGLRVFTEDSMPVLGCAEENPSFFWAAGQGGAGIQTSPATGRAIASLLLTGELPFDLLDCGLTPADLGPSRLVALNKSQT